VVPDRKGRALYVLVFGMAAVPAIPEKRDAINNSPLRANANRSGP
jgi:hypothetical protein